MALVRILLVAILVGSGSLVMAQQAKMKGGFIDAPGHTPRASDAVDNGMMAFPAAYRPSNSPWDSAERARYQSLFPAKSFDVLIVPYQVSGYALDRSTRSLMFAQLVLAVRDAGVRVPDPYPVLRPLGENRRQYSPDEVYEFAHRLGVKRVIWTYCGHNRKNAMSFEFRAKEAASDGYFGGSFEYMSDRFDYIPFSNDSPPIVAYQALLPRIVEKLDYKPRAPSAKKSSRFDGLALPSSPSAMTAHQPDPAKDALYFLTFAALTPRFA